MQYSLAPRPCPLDLVFLHRIRDARMGADLQTMRENMANAEGIKPFIVKRRGIGGNPVDHTGFPLPENQLQKDSFRPICWYEISSKDPMDILQRRRVR